MQVIPVNHICFSIRIAFQKFFRNLHFLIRIPFEFKSIKFSVPFFNIIYLLLISGPPKISVCINSLVFTCKDAYELFHK